MEEEPPGAWQQPRASAIGVGVLNRGVLPGIAVVLLKDLYSLDSRSSPINYIIMQLQYEIKKVPS
jgi:hypothetical protein